MHCTCSLAVCTCRLAASTEVHRFNHSLVAVWPYLQLGEAFAAWLSVVLEAVPAQAPALAAYGEAVPDARLAAP